ncbi:hypothetical protein DF037_28710 [Burkholderia contaminans]|uniref:Uncharacterized protein n=1 Tax=Burkholderia contaminans TaxID=488447 RepID=A0A3N8QEW7_9BURK|nr:hypothetical protein DF037_28710 [Burkholderia contaminans]
MASREGTAPWVTRNVALSLPAPGKKWLGKFGAGAACMPVILICSFTWYLLRRLHGSCHPISSRCSSAH